MKLSCNEKSFTYQGQSLREDVVPDVVPSDGESIQLDWVTVLQCHLDGLEVSVHGNINTCDGAVHLSPVLQLDGDCLMTEFHQEPDKFHFLQLLF